MFRYTKRLIVALSIIFLFPSLFSISRKRVQVFFTSLDVPKETEEYRVWFEDCTYLLLDLGANRGDTILRWLTEKNYNGRAKSFSTDEIYSFEQRKKFCILSFEPNGIFDTALLEIEKKMNKRGFKVKVKPRTAVSDIFSESVIYLDEISTHAYGTSLISGKKVNFEGQLHPLGKEQDVNLVDLTSIIKSIPKSIEIVVKMDIEGGEYDVFRSIIPSGVACRIKLLIVEYHWHKLRKGSIPSGVNEVIEWMLKENRCGVRIVHDD